MYFHFLQADGDLLTGPKISFYRTMKELTPNGVLETQPSLQQKKVFESAKLSQLD
jgi:hypothetical protein